MKIKTNMYSEFGKFSKRKIMVEKQLKKNGIRNGVLLDAFLTIPRHIFVPFEEQEKSYQDTPLSIGYQQTISQPYVVALMLEELQLKPNFKVLEIGSGSGYVCALMSLLVKRVVGVELQKELVTYSIDKLKKLNIKNTRIYHSDGYLGYSKDAPYDAIIVSAAPKEVPETLFSQLKPSGKLIIPEGEAFQELVMYTKDDGDWVKRIITEVRFVPLRHK